MTSLPEYSDKVKEHFLKPKNFGKMTKPDAKGQVGSPACGDIMELFLKVDKKTKEINDIKFQTFGCAAAIASTSVLTEMVKGKTLAQAKKLTMKDIKEKLEDLPKIKLHCSVMAIQALRKAIENYELQN
ncbi:MAG: iron-sulfur cluster assembly scaffold protein [Nanoarchaeota archaeon]|nr:iron-sulfur cluster assembly scaffold protein [Nanoarchaeota archaeon]